MVVVNFIQERLDFSEPLVALIVGNGRASLVMEDSRREAVAPFEIVDESIRAIELLNARLVSVFFVPCGHRIGAEIDILEDAACAEDL
jgi:hypothetical protein